MPTETDAGNLVATRGTAATTAPVKCVNRFPQLGRKHLKDLFKENIFNLKNQTNAKTMVWMSFIGQINSV